MGIYFYRGNNDMRVNFNFFYLIEVFKRYYECIEFYF